MASVTGRPTPARRHAASVAGLLPVVAAALLACFAGAAGAQLAGQQDPSFEYRAAGWNHALDCVEQALASEDLADDTLSQMHSRAQ